jgi:hypothetical protein
MHARRAVLTAASALLSTGLDAAWTGDTLWGMASAVDVRVLWCDPMDALPRDAGEVTREVDRLFAPLGVRISWRAESPCEAREDDVIMIVLPRDRAPRPAATIVMGAATLSGDPKVWVFVENVARTIGLEREPSAPRERVLLTRGLARVVAHEIMHVLAPSVRHGKGLMAARLGVVALTAPEAAFETALGRALLPVRMARRPPFGGAGTFETLGVASP